MGEARYPAKSGMGEARYPAKSGMGEARYPTKSGMGEARYPAKSGMGEARYPAKSGIPHPSPLPRGQRKRQGRVQDIVLRCQFGDGKLAHFHFDLGLAIGEDTLQTFPHVDRHGARHCTL